MQNEIRARRLWASSSNTNILAVREMIEGDLHLTMWEIATHVAISYESAQGLPKSIGKVGSSPLDGRSESKSSCVRKTWHDIEQNGMISWGTLSLVIRRRCIITSRSLNRQAGNLEKQQTKLVFVLEKFLQRFFWDSRRILLIDFLHERRTVNAAYHYQLLD